jgi:hypothetical protein
MARSFIKPNHLPPGNEVAVLHYLETRDLKHTEVPKIVNIYPHLKQTEYSLLEGTHGGTYWSEFTLGAGMPLWVIPQIINTIKDLCEHSFSNRDFQVRNFIFRGSPENPDPPDMKMGLLDFTGGELKKQKLEFLVASVNCMMPCNFEWQIQMETKAKATFSDFDENIYHQAMALYSMKMAMFWSQEPYGLIMLKQFKREENNVISI